MVKSAKKSEQGFSLVEMAIVMVIIGLIVAAVTVGKSTMQSAETLKAYQKVVVPCVAAAGEGIRNGLGPSDNAALKASTRIQATKLDGKSITCDFEIERGAVVINNAPDDLKSLMKKNLDNGVDVAVDGATIKLYVPGTDT